jgi:hypothetical protein
VNDCEVRERKENRERAYPRIGNREGKQQPLRPFSREGEPRNEQEPRSEEDERRGRNDTEKEQNLDNRSPVQAADLEVNAARACRSS